MVVKRMKKTRRVINSKITPKELLPSLINQCKERIKSWVCLINRILWASKKRMKAMLVANRLTLITDRENRAKEIKEGIASRISPRQMPQQAASKILDKETAEADSKEAINSIFNSSNSNKS